MRLRVRLGQDKGCSNKKERGHPAGASLKILGEALVRKCRELIRTE